VGWPWATIIILYNYPDFSPQPAVTATRCWTISHQQCQNYALANTPGSVSIRLTQECGAQEQSAFKKGWKFLMRQDRRVTRVG
jgi:hypothetical protein